MASGSGTQRNSQLRNDSPRPKHRTDPYPSTPNRISRIGHGSAPSRVSSPMDMRSKQPTANSPLQAELARLRVVLIREKARLSGLPQVQHVIGELEKCLDYLQIQRQDYLEYKKLICDLTNLLPLLWHPFIESNPQNIPRVVIDIAASIKKEIENTGMPQSQPQAGQLPTAGSGAKVLDHLRGVQKHFEKLQVEISSWEEKRERWMDARLKDLLPTYEAYYNAALPTTATKRVACTENTRVDLLGGIWTWAREHYETKIYWLNGMAGTGKTTIAYSVCKMLQEDGRLAASFFCSRNSLECRDVNRIIPTIAYQLARYSNPYRHRLCNVFEEDWDVARRDISTQFKYLISRPLSTMGEAIASNVVIMIDALDECADVNGTRDVLDMLLRHAGNTPIKFFVTSRPEPAIIQPMMSSRGAMRSILWLHDIEKSLVQADIKIYLAEALLLAQVTPSELDALADRAGCLFIFAATAVRYIVPSRGAVDHKQRLQTVLKLRPSRGNKSHQDIDDLYRAILSNALDEEVFEEEELAVRRQVLWTVACASGPLTVSGIAELLELPNIRAVDAAIQPVQSILQVSEANNVVSTLHASFPDFLLDKERAGQLHCNEILQNTYLAKRCFQIMSRSLRFNICKLKSSYMLDQDIPNLQCQIDKQISPVLFYACRYWGDHLAKCPPAPLLLSLLNSFMQQHLLFWMEVLNLRRHAGHGDGVLGQALTWLLTEQNSADLQDFINDARNFTTIFASDPVSLSTPHIYISALPFMSKKSRVWATYWPRTRGLIRVESAATEARGKSALATWVAGGPVYCIAQSNDGRRIVSGLEYPGRSRIQVFNLNYSQSKSNGGQVSVWDTYSGTRIIGPLDKHNERVCAVAFSPGDTFIASGSADRTICIWDAGNGHLLAGPLHGHTDGVNCLSFSLDDACLASGSDDQTIRLWDAYSGTPHGEPLGEQQGCVMSVAFSPDGQHLAAGLQDSSIRVWDWRRGTMVRRIFDGYTAAVYSVAYSPDGLRLVSGSGDHAVRVWDISSGTLQTGPFRGHDLAVLSVAFSPNGGLVVSGSSDKTIQVWEAESGISLAGRFEGHSNSVNSVLFTFDGTRILSGSSDGTICVWDARHRSNGSTEPSGRANGILCVAISPDGTRAAAGSRNHAICIWDAHKGVLHAGPMEGHTGSVNSVAFSPDGVRVVSGSDDRTLRIWDSSTGALLAGPFEGHTDWVKSVAFSPDGDQVASGSYDGTIRTWNSYSGASIAKLFNSDPPAAISIAYSPDGARLVSGSWDRTVRMWLVCDSTPLWISKSHTGSVNCVAFSPDGTKVVSGSWDILILDASNGAVLGVPLTGHTNWVNSIAFSPDGLHTVSGSWDETLRIWDVQSGVIAAGPFKGHTDGVESVAFSPDGARVISGSTDRTVRFWDIAASTKLDAICRSDLSLNDEGWLTGSESSSQLLLWVPPDLREIFKLPSLSNPIIIRGSCSSCIDDSTLLLGDEWDQCYMTSPLPTD